MKLFPWFPISKNIPAKLPFVSVSFLDSEKYAQLIYNLHFINKYFFPQ